MNISNKINVIRDLKSKKKNKLIILIIFLLFTIFSFAQNIKGVVVDESTKNFIVGAHIYLKNREKGDITNDKGEFNLKIESNTYKNDTIYFSHVGYFTKKISISKLKENKPIVIHLSFDVQNLEKVSVTSKKKLKSKIHFNKLTSLKVGIHSFGSILIGDKLYVIGGNKSLIRDEVKRELSIDRLADPQRSLVDIVNSAKPNLSWESYSGKLFIYDIKSDIWNESNSEFRKRAYNSIQFYNNKIYVFGGKRLSTNRLFEYLDDKIEIFDLNDNSILIDNVNPHQAVNFASVLKDESLIVLGGSTKLNKKGIKEFSNKIHLYDFKSGYWYELANMPTPKEAKGVLVNDKIYLIGGFNKNASDEVESFDLKIGKWKMEGRLFTAMRRPALAYNDNIIYIFENGRILTYSVKTKELNEYLIGLNLKSSELFYANNKLYLLGGYREDEFSITPSPDFFSIDLNEFEKTRIKNSKRF